MNGDREEGRKGYLDVIFFGELILQPLCHDTIDLIKKFNILRFLQEHFSII